MLLSQADPNAVPAFTISVIAAVISGLSFIVALLSLLWNIRSWRSSGALVKVEGHASKGGAAQFIKVVVRNTGRHPISVTAVLLFESGNGRKPDRGSALYLGSGPDGALPGISPYRLESNASLEFDEVFQRGTPLYGWPRYWVDVELATGRTVSTKWFKNTD